MPHTENQPPTRTPYQRNESALVGIDARFARSAGTVGGPSMAKWILPNGRPIMVERLRDGGIEVYAPIVNSNSLIEVEAALHKLAEV
jgi:hypothetical protein